MLLLQKVIYETSNSGNSGDLELSDLQGHTCNEGLQNAIFRTVVQQLTRFQLT